VRQTLLFVAVVGLLVGCGAKPEFAAVTGTVTLNGKPLADAEVVFVPGTGGPTSAAYTDADGQFTLYCEAANTPGAVVGMHSVLVRDLTVWKAAGGATPPKARVPERYTTVFTTPLSSVSVPAGGPHAIPIAVTSP
jgi:hypothetical protein